MLENLENIESEHKEFQKNTDDRLAAILSCVNTEYKSAELGWALDNIWRTGSNIRKIIETYIYSNIGIPGEASFKDYCEWSFIPIGVVAKGKIISQGKTNPVSHYKLTDEGFKSGKPIAQFALKTSVDGGLSMYEILGVTSSPGDTRSPFNIAKMLLELEKENNLKSCDFEKKFDIISAGKHLNNLKNIGFVDYDSTTQKTFGCTQYEWVDGKNPDDVVIFRGYKTLTKLVAIEAKKLGVFDSNILNKIIKPKYESQTGEILTDLGKQGFVKQNSKFKPTEKLSEASITPKGRKFVKDFLQPVYDALQNDDITHINEQIAIFNDPEISRNYISKAFKLYERVCPAYKKQTPEENMYDIVKLLRSGELTRTEMNDRLGKKISFNYLKELHNKKIVSKRQVGNEVFYYLK